MTWPVRGWSPTPTLWSIAWPYLAAVVAGVIAAIVIFAVLAGWP